MNYCSSIVVDFGSTNSGCARIELERDHIGYRTPDFIQGNQTYAKDNTWFFVHPDFWKKICDNYNDISDTDFRIRSRALPYTKEPNIVWGRQHIRALADTLENEKWIDFKFFKMKLYHNEDFVVDGQRVSIKEVVRLFLRILKIECLDYEKGRRNRPVVTDEIQWGITIPTIWGNRERELMTEIAEDVLGNHVRVLSEPEGPILSALIHSTGNGIFALKKSRVNLVVDIGGGTTDITLMEEISEDAACEYPLRVVAATDGVGVGGNNIDEAYWTYVLRTLSKGKMSDDGCIYDSLNDVALKEMLLAPFVKKLGAYLDMEDKWLEFKHGQSSHINFPPAYRKWLKNSGHNQIAAVLTSIMTGEEDIDVVKLKQHVFQPTFQTITNKVREFLQRNIGYIPENPDLCVVVKAGGLSLSADLRDLIDMEVNNLGLAFTSASLGADSLNVSGSIMDGACVVLLNRKIINRKAPFNIYYNINLSLVQLRDNYKNLGINMNIGQLQDLLDDDIKNGATMGAKADPIGIKGEFLKDSNVSFTPVHENQEKVSFKFYGCNDGFIVLPYNNPKCWLLGEKTFETHGYQSFTLLIDFNEFPNNNNFHYFITSESNGEVMAEGNIHVKV